MADHPPKPFPKHNTLGTPFPKGRSGNPGGLPSLKKDIARAKEIGLLPELHHVLDEWVAEAPGRLRELGADGFVVALQAAIRAACEIDLPSTPEVARAMWLRRTLTVAFAGPNGSKDSVWTYANADAGNRLLGKPREHVVVESAEAPPIDWSRVPSDRKEALLEAIVELQGYLTEPAPTEH